jgi:hypothetical protein
MVLTTAKTVIFFRKPSSSVFSVKSHWIKTQISGMVELGVLMKFHYRKSFDNPVVVSEGVVQSWEKFESRFQRWLCHLTQEQATDLGVSALDRE